MHADAVIESKRWLNSTAYSCRGDGCLGTLLGKSRVDTTSVDGASGLTEATRELVD